MADSNQIDPDWSEGDLFAHIDGDSNPSIEEEVAASPELAELVELDGLLQRTFGGSALPEPQDMVDVVMGQATAMQRLIVAAYVRDSVRGKAEMAALEKELADERGSTPLSLASRLPRFIATPIATGLGLRSQTKIRANEIEEQTFEVIDLQIQITLRIVPPIREIWAIEGYCTQQHQPIAEAKISLQSEQQEPQECDSDSDGFFAFRELADGQYSLNIELAESVITIPALNLTDEDG